MRKLIIAIILLSLGCLVYFYENKLEEVSVKAFVLGCQVSKQTYCRKTDNCNFKVCKNFLEDNPKVLKALKGREVN